MAKHKEGKKWSFCDAEGCKKSSNVREVFFRLGDCKHEFCYDCKNKNTEEREQVIRCLLCNTNNLFQTSGVYSVPEKIGPWPEKVSGLRGMQSQNLNCYMNVLIQVLAQTPGFIEQLINGLQRISREEGTDFTNTLLNLLLDIKNPDETVNGHDLVRNEDHFPRLSDIMKKIDSSFSPGQENDCHSSFLCIISILQDELGQESMEMFEGKMRSCFRYPGACKHEELTHPQRFVSLLIPISAKFSSVEEGVNSLLRREMINNSPIVCQHQSCRGKEKMNSLKQLEIIDYPEILVLQLARFEEVEHVSTSLDSDRVTRTLQKYNGKVTYTENLRLKSNDPRNQPKKEPPRYSLYAIVRHQGNLETGHYMTYVKVPQENMKHQSSSRAEGSNACWYNCTDTCVTKWRKQGIPDVDDAYLLFYSKCK